MKRSPKKTKRQPAKTSPRPPKAQKPKPSKKAVHNGNNSTTATPEFQPAAMPVEVREQNPAVLEQIPEVSPLETTLQLSGNVAVPQQSVATQLETLLVQEEPVELLPLPQLLEQTQTPSETIPVSQIIELQEQTVAAIPQETLEAPIEIPEAPQGTPTSPIFDELPINVSNPFADTPANAQDAALEIIPLCVDPLAVDPVDQSEYSVAETAEPTEVAEITEITVEPVVTQPEPADSPTYVELQDEIDQFMSATETHKPAATPAAIPAPPPKQERELPPPPPPKPSDRRNHPRYAFQAQIQVTDTHSKSRISSSVRDLSQRGCYANTPNPFPLGTNVDVIIIRSSKSFSALARAVYNDPGKGMGLMFTDIEPQHRATLDAWISESRETNWLAANRRRSQRVMMRLPIRIATAEPSGAHFDEDTHTVAVSAHGALLVLKAPVSRGQRLTLTNLSTKAAIECLVAHIDKPSSAPLQIGVEFLFADPAFWRVAFPPKDWTPRHPDAKSK